VIIFDSNNDDAKLEAMSLVMEQALYNKQLNKRSSSTSMTFDYEDMKKIEK